MRNPDPIRRFETSYAKAKGLREAMVLATADARGRPSARVVLFKGISHGAFRFFTNYRSSKSKELEVNPWAALVFHWPDLKQQIRIVGRVRKSSSDESDAYWRTRPRESQIGAYASDQSRALKSFAELARRERAERARFKAREEIPRPAHWGGYLLTPGSIEFWSERAGRLHHRQRFKKTAGRWREELLFP